MHHSSDSLIRVLVSDDSRVHTELLADVLRRDGQFEVKWWCFQVPAKCLKRQHADPERENVRI